jgi:hypothetical protein
MSNFSKGIGLDLPQVFLYDAFQGVGPTRATTKPGQVVETPPRQKKSRF